MFRTQQRMQNGVCLLNEYNGTIRVKMRTLAVGWEEVTIGTLLSGDRANHRSNGDTVRVQVKFEDRRQSSIVVASKYGSLGMKLLVVTPNGMLSQRN